jgi:hypothetical protein
MMLFIGGQRAGGREREERPIGGWDELAVNRAAPGRINKLQKLLVSLKVV